MPRWQNVKAPTYSNIFLKKIIFSKNHFFSKNLFFLFRQFLETDFLWLLVCSSGRVEVPAKPTTNAIRLFTGAWTLSTTTLSIMTVSIATLRTMTLSITTLRITTLSIMTLSITTLIIKGLSATLSINITQHNSIECHFAAWYYT
jgi:hypothetical protein